jgi:hypothetical protein
MKKITSTLLCILASYSFSQASILQFGPRIAVHTSNLKAKTQEDQNVKFNFITGFRGGVVARIDLPVVFIQPELLVSRTGTNYRWQGREANLRFTKLELPVMVGISILGLARIQAGPTLSLLLTAKENLRQAADIKDVDVKLDYETLHVGYQVGIGVDIWRFIADLKYEGGLTKFGNKIAGIPTESKQTLWSFSLGFNIL